MEGSAVSSARPDDRWPGRAINLAAEWLLHRRRLELQGLADELGVSRVTVFRKAGNRDDLIRAALWKITRDSLNEAADAWEAERRPDQFHSQGAARHLNAIVAKSDWLHTLFANEPALAIRLMTDPRGQVQTGVVRFFEQLMLRDAEEFDIEWIIDPGTFAFALVRLGESFLYADVLASRRPDVAVVDKLQEALLAVAWRRRD